MVYFSEVAEVWTSLMRGAAVADHRRQQIRSGAQSARVRSTLRSNAIGLKRPTAQALRVVCKANHLPAAGQLEDLADLNLVR
ncbi:MAG: hypothetical protein DMG57_32135 [Acidobacteria bacterium]|nr:MAG: hypothetical protein DMG57_32135 [Acidobacteriota bacterium]